MQKGRSVALRPFYPFAAPPTDLPITDQQFEKVLRRGRLATLRTTANSEPLERHICVRLVIVGLVVFLLVRNEPISDPRLFFVLRAVLSFGVATLARISHTISALSF